MKFSQLRELGYGSVVPAEHFYDPVQFHKPQPKPETGYVPPARKTTAKHAGKRCCYCGAAVRKLTRDHVHPKSQGGNVTLGCCKLCNQLKRDLTLAQFRALLKAMLGNVDNLLCDHRHP